MKKSLVTLGLLVLVFIAFSYLHSKQDIYQALFVDKNKCEGVDIKIATALADNIESGKVGYESSSKDIWGKSSEGGEQVDYYVDDKTVLIEQVFYGETGKSEASYYLKDGNVFYFHKENTLYKFPIYHEEFIGEVASIDIKDFYLGDEEELCSWYLDGELQTNDKDVAGLVDFLISGLQ